MDILLLNGPNLNMLGTREPDHYGAQTLDDIVNQVTDLATQAGLTLGHHQDNAEVGLIERIHQAHKDGVKYIIINDFNFYAVDGGILPLSLQLFHIWGM